MAAIHLKNADLVIARNARDLGTLRTRILQLRIELKHLKPLIWRRLEVPAQASFWDLHVAIQSAFNWQDRHLHEFRGTADAGKTWRFGIPLPDHTHSDPLNRPLPGWIHRIADHLNESQPRLDYVYDFGDDWQHRVILEGEFKRIPGRRYPRCTDGARAAPPEDCGGIPGYQGLIEALQDPQHPEHAFLGRWIKGGKKLRERYDPEAFDSDRIKFTYPAPRLSRLLAANPKSGFR